MAAVGGLGERHRGDRRAWWTACVAVVVVASTVPLLAAHAPRAQAAFPGVNGKIAFGRETSPGSGVNHIFVMNPDGSGQTDLTPTEPQGFSLPAWNADSTKLAFQDDTGIGT